MTIQAFLQTIIKLKYKYEKNNKNERGIVNNDNGIWVRFDRVIYDHVVIQFGQAQAERWLDWLNDKLDGISSPI